MLLTDRDLLRFALYTATHPMQILRSLKESKSSNLWNRPIVEKISESDQNKPIDTSIITLPLRWKNNNELSKKLLIRLATKDLLYDTLQSINWSTSWDDKEDEAALHRFSWLLPLVLDLANEGIDTSIAWNKIAQAIDDWCTINSNVDSSRESWQPYTVSERSVNWIITFLSCKQKYIKNHSISVIIEKQAEHILKNLEYHGELLTGNHLSNNGRALYLTGLVTGNSKFIENGKSILTAECKRLFKEPRFLREGSSHYQFLVTRNYCEVLWFAKKFADDDMVEKILPVVSELDKGCKFFLVKDDDGKWNIPLIGDISPDCTPEWLIGVPWVSSQLTDRKTPNGNNPPYGWHRFFYDETHSFSDISSKTPEIDVGEEWAKIQKDEWTVFSHINPKGYPIVAGHAHQDTAALSVFYMGKPFIIDCGRLHYIEDRLGQRGRDCWAHSIAIIDNNNPNIYFRKFYPKQYLEKMKGNRQQFLIKNTDLSIVHNGFARIKGVGNHIRKVICEMSSISIQDCFEGKGIHKICIIFNFWGTLREKNSTMIIESFDQSFTIKSPDNLKQQTSFYGSSKDGRFGWASIKYGDFSNILTFVFSGKITLPWTGTTVIKKVA